MKLERATHLSEVSKLVYQPSLTVARGYKHVDRIVGPTFPAYVMSNESEVVLAFRGTVTSLSNEDSFTASILQWLTNFNVAQYVIDNEYRVHKGFHDEVLEVWHPLVTVVRDHGAHVKPFYVTGHSAGAALATVAARYLHSAGIAGVDGVYAYASPRVGDKTYRDSYPVPLFRFENMDDLVPHLPPPPSIMGAIDFVLEDLYPIINAICPQMLAYAPASMEYVHCGQLFFFDWDGELVYTKAFLDLLDEEFDEDPKKERWPGQPVPKMLMDAARALNTAANIAEHFSQGKFGFISHHNLVNYLQSLGTVVKKLSIKR